MTDIVNIIQDNTYGVTIDTVGGLVVSGETPTTIFFEESHHIVENDSPPRVTISSDPIHLISLGIQGPPGVAGPPGSSLLQLLVSGVAVGATVVLDAIAISAIRAAKWLITISDVANKHRYAEVAAIHNGSTAAGHAYGFDGDPMFLVFDTIVSTGALTLTLKNNHTSTVDARVVRIPVSL